MMELEGDCGIYCYSNKVNGKKYVGQSIMLRIRIRDHERNFTREKWENTSAGESKLLWRAVRKYGRSNFDFSVLEYANADNLDDLEIKYINLLGSHVSKNGYNISFGGDSTKGIVMSSKTRKRMSKVKTGKGNPFFGKLHSEESRKKMSETRKKNKDSWYLSGESHFNYGRIHSQSAKIRMSNSRMETRNWRFGKKMSGSSSIYFGVRKDNKCKNIWVAGITYKTKKITIGRFTSEIDAANAYNQYIVNNQLPHPLNKLGELI